MNNPTDETVEAWVRLVRAYQTAFQTVEAALKAAGHPPLAWYDLLLELDRAGAEGLRAQELVHHLLLPQYGVSRLVGRIEKAGYLKRQACPDDGRGWRLVITAAGKKLRRRMWPVYAKAIQEAVGTKLTPKQAKTLAEILGRLSGQP